MICRCGHLALTHIHTDITDERCSVSGCDCREFLRLVEKIVVRYSCRLCGLLKVECLVPVRDPAQDVVRWMEQTGALLSADQRQRSPRCHPKELQDIMIPLTGRDRIGGPSVN